MSGYKVPKTYSFKTRIGNWSEEYELNEIKKQDYENLKNSGKLKSAIINQKMNNLTKQASLTFSKDGLLRFNDQILLLNGKSQGLLALDNQPKALDEGEKFPVSTTTDGRPCIRSIWILEKFQKELYQDNCLRYGQKFLITAHSRAYNKKLYLSSSQNNIQKIESSNVCDVYLTPHFNFNCVWVVEHIDPNERFEAITSEVLANSQVIFKHASTGQMLASNLSQIENCFGLENIVNAKSHYYHSKSQNLVAEKTGRSTGDIALRNQHLENTWYIITAQDPIQEFDESSLDKPKNAIEIATDIRDFLKSQGIYGLNGLAKTFLVMDEDRSGELNVNEFTWGLRSFGIFLSEEHVHTLFDAFDENKNSSISLKEFLLIIRGPLLENRRKLIEKAFFKLQGTKDKIFMADIVKAFNAKGHPDYLNGKKADFEVFKDFIRGWECDKPETILNWYSFLYYFEVQYLVTQNISALIDSDETFDTLMKGIWNL